ncbi:MAG: hypothetical protein HN919_01875 [Verrucomicrobia bacterium]|jgi:hypothetical protein|nr:hypothetical protein [Verrucomicrobiota bacterium]
MSNSNMEQMSAERMLDGLLKHRESLFQEIVKGTDVGTKLKWFTLSTLALLGLYGLSMGIYNGPAQAAAALVKMPMLFFLTLLVCFPVLHVLNVLFGAKTRFLSTLALIMASITTASIILGACAPIIFFFVISGSGYSFMKLLHVFVTGTAASIGVISMYRGLMVVCENDGIYPKSAIRILRIWLFIFAFVGTQMVWSLRPLVGDRSQKFEIIRSNREGNFYSSVIHSVKDILND